MATEAGEVAQTETDKTVWAKADLYPIAGQEKHTEKTVLTKTTNQDHTVNNTVQNPKTGIAHLIKGITTTGKDQEVIHLQEAMITTEIASQKREIISARAGQMVETTHFIQKLMLSI